MTHLIAGPEPAKGEPDLDQDESLADADQTEDEIDPLAEDDALAAMDPADFCRLLRAQVEKVQRGELPGGVEDAHPITPPKPKPRKFSRRAISMSWLVNSGERMRRACRY